MTTLLGSCVAITLWHPGKHFGGMCHFVLPRRPEGIKDGNSRPDPRYAVDCMRIFRDLALKRGTRLTEFQGRIFGGGNMLPGSNDASLRELADSSPVGDINAAEAFAGLTAEGVRVMEADVGEQGYRRVWFYPCSGKVEVKFVALSASQPRYGI
ncbi:chemoreceptor glutamine deamidase CheD [Bowmanella dokdonensis]